MLLPLSQAGMRDISPIIYLLPQPQYVVFGRKGRPNGAGGDALIPQPSFGLRYSRSDGRSICLIRIAGLRVLFRDGHKKWWSKPPVGVHWEIYPEMEHRGYSLADAKEILESLSAAATPR